MKFLPLFKKRIDQIQEMERINRMIENELAWAEHRAEASKDVHQANADGLVGLSALMPSKVAALALQTASSDKRSKAPGIEESKTSLGPRYGSDEGGRH